MRVPVPVGESIAASHDPHYAIVIPRHGKPPHIALLERLTFGTPVLLGPYQGLSAAAEYMRWCGENQRLPRQPYASHRWAAYSMRIP